MLEYYLAIDLGATSGRHIIGWKDEGRVRTEEVYRFPNGIEKTEYGLIWDTERLLEEVQNGICAAFARCGKLAGIAVDTWGVDYVLMKDGIEAYPCFSYRDPRTEEAAKEVHGIVPPAELYRRTGLQQKSFNTVYQLYDDLKKGRLAYADEFMLLPDYINYKLTGVRKREYTIASTTGLLDARTGEYDTALTDALGLPRHLFGRLNRPGEAVGMLLPEIAARAGGNATVTLCASHDTASAFECAEERPDEVILSSGTWSLLGIKRPEPDTSEASLLAGYTNEGGAGYIRYLKNITGLWLLSRLRQEFSLSAPEGEKLAQTSDYKETFDVDGNAFVCPDKMSAAIRDTMVARGAKPPETPADYLKSAYLSLAEGYKRAVEGLERVTGKRYHGILVVGGGAKDNYLNALTERATGKRVRPFPGEATALGNLKIQMRGHYDKI